MQFSKNQDLGVTLEKGTFDHPYVNLVKKVLQLHSYRIFFERKILVGCMVFKAVKAPIPAFPEFLSL